MTTIQLSTAPGVLLPLGGQWTLGVETRDASGYLSGEVTPTLAVTLPDGTSAAPVFEAAMWVGGWLATYTPSVTGRFLAHAFTPEDAVDAAAYVAGPTSSTDLPTVDDVARYLKGGASSWTSVQLQEELDGEAYAQQAKCGVRAEYPPDLRKALLRRVQRALAFRALPLATLRGDADGGSLVLPGNDPEIRRLEAPYRKLVTG